MTKVCPKCGVEDVAVLKRLSKFRQMVKEKEARVERVLSSLSRAELGEMAENCLDVSIRGMNAIKRAGNGKMTVATFLLMSREEVKEFIKVPNCGAKTVQELLYVWNYYERFRLGPLYPPKE